MDKKCKICNKKLQGSQRKYCSNSCKCKGYFQENTERNSKLSMNSYYRQTIKGYIRKLKLIKLSGGGCSVCGYKKNISSLNFHHKDANKKEFNLDGRSLSNRSWEVILKEYEKCILLCANCHGEEHHPEMDISKIQNKIKESFDKIKILPPKSERKKIKNKCIDCGCIITNKAKRCKKCCDISLRKSKRPNIKTLLKETKETSYSAVGRKYKVSDNTIKKWIKYYKNNESNQNNTRKVNSSLV